MDKQIGKEDLDMTGLEKIKNQILTEAREKAEQKTQAARKEAEEILAGSRQAAEEEAARQEEKSRADGDSYRDRVKSSCELKRRTMILEAKQKMIRKVLDQAYQSLVEAGPEKAFSVMEKLLDQAAQPQDGVMYLSQEELDHMPSDFEKKAAEIAGKKGGTLKIAKEAKKLDGGFILVYGGIEENCTWKALFDSNWEKLQDLVNGYLWRDDNG